MSIPKPLVQLNQSFIVISVVMALIFHSAILWIPFLVGVYTLVTRQNPVISFGKKLLKKPLDEYVPEDNDQQVFNQWIATICLGLSLACFYFGLGTVGFIFSIMVVVAAGVALMGFCIGCQIRYRYMMWKHKRTKLQP